MKTSSTALTLVLVAAILGVLNYLVGGLGFLNLRADLTEKKIFTLSEGTRRIIERLNPDKAVSIRFYATRDSRLMPQFVQSYATSVEDLLLEFEKAGRGKITLERIDPRPDTEEEDRAVADDIQGHVMGADGSKAYFGLAVQCLQQKEVMAVLNPNDEASLEYQIARALAKVSQVKKTVVGVMSAMPIAGPAFNFPPMMQQNQPQPWLVMQQLKLDYEVREVAPSVEAIDADINVLLVVHPAEFSTKAEFAIDQYLLKGGKVVALVDPQCLVSQVYNNQGGGMMGQRPSFVGPVSDLPALFKAWGIGYDKNSIVADMNLRTVAQGRPQPTFLTLSEGNINREDPVTSSLQSVQLFGAGGLTLEKKDGIRATELLQSTENSDLIDSSMAEKSRNASLNEFQRGGKRRLLGLRLDGKFVTAFPDGPPKGDEPAGLPKLPGETGGAEADAGAPTAAAAEPAPAAAAPEPAKPAYLKESAGSDGVVFLFSDVDMLYDMFAFETGPGGSIMPIARNGNIPLLLNTVEMLAGGADLIGVRSRAVTKRPFTRMEQLRDQVEAEYRPQIEASNQKLNEIVQKIADLGGVKQEKGLVVLNINQEQRKQLLDEQTRIQKDLRDLQKAQNSRKDKLEMSITLVNLLVVPLLVIVFGILVAARRRSVQAAR